MPTRARRERILSSSRLAVASETIFTLFILRYGTPTVDVTARQRRVDAACAAGLDLRPAPPQSSVRSETHPVAQAPGASAGACYSLFCPCVDQCDPAHTRRGI